MPMNQIDRIKYMEGCFDRASEAVKQLTAALDLYAEVQEDIRQLSDYYGSKDWKSDFAADEAGRLPADLKRGVLSEDAVWNLLTDIKAIDERIVSR